MPQVTKSCFRHLLGYQIINLCTDRGPSQFCKASTNFEMILLDDSVTLCGRLVTTQSVF